MYMYDVDGFESEELVKYVYENKCECSAERNVDYNGMGRSRSV